MERTEFLRKVRESLGRTNSPPLPLPRWQPPSHLFFEDLEERTRVFRQQATDIGVTVHQVETREEARKGVQRLVSEMGWTGVAAIRALWWEGLKDLWTDNAATAAFGLDEAQWALAETGTLVIETGGNRRRDVSSLPPAVGFFLPRSKILSRLTDLCRKFTVATAPIPVCITLISGPSQTGDIEGVLTREVHGPGEVHVWVIGDE